MSNKRRKKETFGIHSETEVRGLLVSSIIKHFVSMTVDNFFVDHCRITCRKLAI